MAWTFSGTFLDGFAAERVIAGTGEPEELPGRYALADAHAHPTVAAGELRERLRDCLPYAVAHGVRVLAGTDVVGTIADEVALLAAHGLTAAQAVSAAGSAARDFLGIHPAGDIVTYDGDPLEDPGVLARPAAVVVRGVRLR
jgi:imidazolonepropionase-like amidohydrolase